MPREQETLTWLGKDGPGGFDLRSDVATTPTANMLRAIEAAPHLDDVWGEDTGTEDLEKLCASLTGKESGLFVLSGTMGNQLALRSLLHQPPHSILCDHRSHIFKSEAGGIALLTSAMVHPIIPSNGVYLTLEDVRAGYSPEGGPIGGCPTRVISLENTLYGTIIPLEEVRRIHAFARENGVKMHCDGARLWEAVAAGAGTLEEYASLFDTVSLCFSKGLGAPVGSILVGDKAVINNARYVRKAIGGGLRQPGLITSAAKVALDETFCRGDGEVLKLSHGTARKVEAIWKEYGGAVKYPVQTNMVWLNLVDAGLSTSRFAELGLQEGLRVSGERLITHYQIYENEEEVLSRIRRVFQALTGAI